MRNGNNAVLFARNAAENFVAQSSRRLFFTFTGLPADRRDLNAFCKEGNVPFLAEALCKRLVRIRFFSADPMIHMHGDKGKTNCSGKFQ